jgi:hypothetical protein
MPNFNRGKLSFAKRYVRMENGADEQIVTCECFPPPAGRRRRYMPETTVAVEVTPQFLQQSERARLVQFAANPGETLAFDSLLNEVLRALAFAPLSIDLKKLPAGWDQVVPCCLAETVYYVGYTVWAVDALAGEALTIGNEVYPVGDVVASFQVRNPDIYTFRRTLSRDPRCCALTGPVEPPIVESAGPFPEPETEFQLDPGFEFRPRLEFRLRVPFFEYTRPPAGEGD